MRERVPAVCASSEADSTTTGSSGRARPNSAIARGRPTPASRFEDDYVEIGVLRDEPERLSGVTGLEDDGVPARSAAAGSRARPEKRDDRQRPAPSCPDYRARPMR